MITTNFHTHTVFCDGKDTPEEMVVKAIEKGFTALGFSGHSYYEHDADISMNVSAQKKYIESISFLKEKYRGKIKIFCGIEQDVLSKKPEFDYEYMIGSVHNLLKDGNVLSVDMSAQTTKEIVENFYGGDFDAFAEEYFSEVSTVVKRTGADIVGHVDLVSKFNEQNVYKETNRYLMAAEKAVKRLAAHKKPFEINTGAMARGYKSVPYPSIAILKMIKNSGGEIMFSSDCHDKEYLDFGFDVAQKIAKEAGFLRHAVITERGIEYLPI